MLCIPKPAEAGLKTPVGETPVPVQTPPPDEAVKLTLAAPKHKGVGGTKVGFGAPVCALGNGPSCSVKLLLRLLQSCATIINVEPAVTLGAGSCEVQENAFPN